MKRFKGEPTPLYPAAYVGGGSPGIKALSGGTEHADSVQRAINLTNVGLSSAG